MIKLSCYDFSSLSNVQLYKILRLRSKIFVLEQKCLYQDMDKLDYKAHHILAEKHNKLIGYSRILEKGNLYSNYSSIGRVLVDNKERGHKVGEKIVKFSIKIIKQKYKEAPIKISAQTYLLDFYKKIGFHHKGRDYLEDGIPHSSMYLE